MSLPGREWLDRDLPLQDAVVIEAPSTPVAISGELNFEYARMRRPDGELALQEWACMIVAEKGGRDPIAAIVDEVTPGEQFVTVQAGGFSMYPEDLPWLGEEFAGVGVDPLDMVRKIWGHVQSYPEGDLKVVVDPLTTPPTMWVGKPAEQVEFTTGAGEDVSFEAGPFRLASWTTHNLGKVITDLAKAVPFEYRERSTWVNGGEQVAHRLELGYPRLGVRRNDIRFEIGVNVAAVPPREEQEYANEVWMLGAGEGRKRLTASAHLINPTKKLRRVRVETDTDLKSKTAAANAARPILDQLSSGYSLDTLVVIDHESAPSGSFECGDEIRIVGDAGWIQLNHWLRILQISENCQTGVRTLRVEES